MLQCDVRSRVGLDHQRPSPDSAALGVELVVAARMHRHSGQVLIVPRCLAASALRAMYGLHGGRVCDHQVGRPYSHKWSIAPVEIQRHFMRVLLVDNLGREPQTRNPSHEGTREPPEGVP